MKITGCTGGDNRRAILVRTLLTMTALACATAAVPAAAQQQAAPALRSEHHFAIPAQALTDALVAFGRQAGLQVSVDGALVRNLQVPAITGRMRAEEALARLLSGTGLVASRTGGRTLVIRQAVPGGDKAITLDTLMIEGREWILGTGAQRDARRQDDIFALDLSTDYLGKEDIDRFRGISTADLFQGLTNVYSGAARNGNALDANIRGIQGAGRAPVIIDGTEQAIVAWRGYAGISNRSYIDPSLIAGIQALKGPVSLREVNSQSGGAIVIKTLDAGDILEPGERFGVELRLEAGNNSTRPRLPTLRTGQDARKIKGFPLDRLSYLFPFGDPTLRVRPRTTKDNGTFSSGGDRAARIAAAARQGDFDFFGAYAYRERGNYFSGKNNTRYYARDDLLTYDEILREVERKNEELQRLQREARRQGKTWTGRRYVDISRELRRQALPMQHLAFNYLPGNEVTNSSSQMQSWLFKTTWRIAFDQVLQLGYRNTRTVSGEIMPSRINYDRAIRNEMGGDVQWPLSRTRIQALNLEYKYAPETPWLDVHANLWMTRAQSRTYSNGGFPNVPSNREDTTLINTALDNNRNNRLGITFSNKMALLPSLDVTVGGHYQYEKLRSNNAELPKGHISFAIVNGREGNRQEYRANLQFEWRPTGFLTFNGGVSHAGYRAFDEGMDARLKRGNEYTQVLKAGETKAYNLQATGLEAYKAVNQSEIKRSRDRIESLKTRLGSDNPFYKRFERVLERRIAEIEEKIRNYDNKPFDLYRSDFSLTWRRDRYGNYRRANMPPLCPPEDPLTGKLRPAPLSAFDLKVVFRKIEDSNKPIPRLNKHRIPAVRKALSGVECRRDSGGESLAADIPVLKNPADNRARHSAGWEPYLTTTLKLSDDIRLYGRYAERLRFPSMYESTFGFSSSPSLLYRLKPERIRSVEAAYIQDFSPLFGLGGNDQRADFKLVYFRNTVDDIIDSSSVDFGVFDNFDRQVIDGVELQARLDTGRFFFDLGAARILSNKVIDESTAALESFRNQRTVPYTDNNANNFGFGGSLLTQAIPAQTLTLTLGGRFFQRRLELGTRAAHYSEYENPEIDGRDGVYTFGKTLILDAYARYNFKDQLIAELVSSNMTDQFYADPLTRSLMPAPGRQIRFNFTYQF